MGQRHRVVIMQSATATSRPSNSVGGWVAHRAAVADDQALGSRRESRWRLRSTTRRCSSGLTLSSGSLSRLKLISLFGALISLAKADQWAQTSRISGSLQIDFGSAGLATVNPGPDGS